MTDKDELLVWARGCFASDRYATEATGITIEELDVDNATHGGWARCRLSLKLRHRNARGAVMGGVFFTLADFSAAIAMNVAESAGSNELHWVSLSGTVNFMAQPRGEELTAVARCIRQGRGTCLYETHITEQDRILACVTTTGMRV